MAENEVTTVFTGDASQFEDVLKRLIKEMRRFATIAEKEIGKLGGGFDSATAASARLEAQQRKTNDALKKAADIEKAAKPQRARDPLADPNFIGPRAQIDKAGRERIDNARRLLVTRKQLADITAEEERKAQNLLKTNKQLSGAVKDVANQSSKAGAGTKELKDNLYDLSNPSLRYALYDVGNSLQRISVALAAVGVAPVAFRIKYEREFANVVRTNDIASDSSTQLRNQLLSDLQDIAQATPINWADITDIAALAGQLGISQELVAGFTENVAKFAATTDLSVDSAATAFGRLNELIDGVNGQFDKLGSAILAVGVDSVATESGIVNVSQQIASMGNLAGLSAADIIGLSGAIASLGIRPELARGNITRLFSNINKSVAESGFALTEYGRLTNRTADEFAEAWRSEPTEVLLDFFQGLQAEGSEAERTLRDIGITSVRDIPAFLRLSQNIDLVRRLIGLSNEEFEKGSKINEQYGIISATTAEQLRRLTGNFELLLASLGGLTGPLSVFLGTLNEATAVVTDFLNTQIGQDFGIIATTLAVAGAALAGLLAAAVTAVAGLVALRFVVRDLGVDFTGFTLRTLFSSKALDAFGLSTLRANKSFQFLATSSKALSLSLGLVGAALTVGGLIYSEYQRRQEAVSAVTNQLLADTDGLAEALQKDAEAVDNNVKAFRELDLSQRAAQESNAGLIDNYEELTGRLEPSNELLEKAGDEVERLRAARDEEAKAVEFQAKASEDFIAVQNESNRAGEESIGVLRSQGDAARQTGDDILYLGNNFARYIQQQAANVPELQEAFAIPELRAAIEQEFGNFPSFVDFAVGDPEEARRRIDEIFSGLRDPQRFTFLKDTGFVNDVNAAELAIEGLIDSIDSDAFINAAEGINTVEEGLVELQEAADIAEGKIDNLLNTLFGSANATRDAQEAVRDFFADLEDGADTSDIASESFQDMVEAIAGNAFRTPAERIADLNAVLQRLQAEGQGNSAQAKILSDAMIQLAIAGQLVDGTFRVLPDHLASSNLQMQEIIGTLQPILGLFDLVGTEVEETGSKFGGAAEEAKTLAEEFEDAISSIFDSVNAAQDAARSVADLGEAYGELGENAFYASSEIQDAVSDITASAATPEEAISNLNALFNRLARTVGSSTAPSLQFLRNTIDRLAQEFGVASDAISQATLDLSFFDDGVKQAQKEVRTLLDYASDIDQVISRAFDIRFADILQIDKIADSWQKLAEDVEDARAAIEELKASQQDLAADRAIKSYFLSVAESYGDMLRAAQLRKEIAELDAEQAQAQRDLAVQQQLVGGDLTGTGEGSRESRAALLGLVQEYQDYITVLAESGASQDELRAATARAREEFIQQATELGFQEQVVLEYAQAFDDVRTAIDNVPRNITVDANVNPALQALNELNAKLNESISLAERLNQVTGGDSSSSRNRRNADPTPTVNTPIEGLPGRPSTNPVITGNTVRVDSGGNPTFGNIISGRVTINVPTGIAAIRQRGFASGGYTGAGGKYQPAGIVHRGEYVVPKQYVNQSTGLPSAGFLAQLQNGMRGYAQGGFVGGMGTGEAMMVELSPYDRKLLADAGNVQLRLNGRVVAEATNANNYNEARRGSN